MIHYEEALAIINEIARNLPPLEKETIPLSQAAGCTCAENLKSRILSPAFPQSTMDGFAVRAESTRTASPTAPVTLAVGGCVAAGDPYLAGGQKDGREAVEIMTGASIPEIYDAVIKIEDVVTRKDTQGKTIAIEIKNPAIKGQFYREPGEDLKPGAPVLSAGTRINSEKILALAAAGIVSLPVYRKLRVGLIATGKEVAPLGEMPGPHQVMNSTAPYLLAAAKRAGCEAAYVGLCGDDPKEFDVLLARALGEKFDVILSTGAVSMGKYDYIPEAVAAHGIHLHFQKVAIKPGKPIIFGTAKNGAAYFGLPGNPVSSAATFRFFVDPFLRARRGRSDERPITVPLSQSITKPQGITCFYKARLAAGSWAVDLIGDQGSHMTRSLVDATGWAVLPDSQETLEAGTHLEFFPYL